MYESGALFSKDTIKNHYQKYEKLDNHQSSFMLYMTIKSNKKYEHHYQLIQDKPYPHTLSNALFVSFSDQDDNLFSKEGHYSSVAKPTPISKI